MVIDNANLRKVHAAIPNDLMEESVLRLSASADEAPPRDGLRENGL